MADLRRILRPHVVPDGGTLPEQVEHNESVVHELWGAAARAAIASCQAFPMRDLVTAIPLDRWIHSSTTVKLAAALSRSPSG